MLDGWIGEGFEHLYIVVFDYLAKLVEVAEELGVAPTTMCTAMTSVNLRWLSSIHTVEYKELLWFISVESGNVWLDDGRGFGGNTGRSLVDGEAMGGGVGRSAFLDEINVKSRISKSIPFGLEKRGGSRENWSCMICNNTTRLQP